MPPSTFEGWLVLATAITVVLLALALLDVTPGARGSSRGERTVMAGQTLIILAFTVRYGLGSVLGQAICTGFALALIGTGVVLRRRERAEP